MMMRYLIRNSFKKSTVKQDIKKTISIINKAIKQIPSDRSIVFTSRINQVLGKYRENMQSDEHLTSFLKQLNFNLNFIKLSNPTLDYSFDQVQSENTQQKTQQQDQSEAINDIMLEGFDENVVKQYSDRIKNVRQQVEFSNWFEGNTNPSDLKKHKQLLMRQHFGGQFWKNEQKPKSMSKQFLINQLAKRQQSNNNHQAPKKDQVLSSEEPQIEQGDEYWEKVKR